MDRKLATTIGVTARGARIRAGLTQADLAERLEMATEVYGRLERGAMLPSVETLLKLSACLRISPNRLLGLEPEKKRAGRDAERASPELERLVRRVERLDRQTLQLLSLIASEMAQPERKSRPPRKRKPRRRA